MKYVRDQNNKNHSYKMANNNEEVVTKKNDDDPKDLTAPYYEVESFNSIWRALQWKQVRVRVPVCFKKTIRSRYMLANLVYLGYAIGILIIDFNPYVNGSSAYNSTDMCDYTSTPDLDQSVNSVPLVNRLYLGK
jgi:hypothetical protein